MAAKKKYDEILEILAPLADNLDAPAPDGMTPTDRAVMYGYGNIFRVLNWWIIQKEYLSSSEKKRQKMGKRLMKGHTKRERKLEAAKTF